MGFMAKMLAKALGCIVTTLGKLLVRSSGVAGPYLYLKNIKALASRDK